MVALPLLTEGARLRATRLNYDSIAPAGSCEGSAAAADDSALSPSPIARRKSSCSSVAKLPVVPPVAPSFQIVFGPRCNRGLHMHHSH